MLRLRTFCLLLALVAVSFLGCDRGPERGTAFLEEWTGSTFKTRDMPPGQEWVLMFMSLSNVSGRDVVVESIRPERDPKGVAEMVSVHLARRSVGDAAELAQGRYMVFPPASGDLFPSADGNECVVQDVQPAEGLMIPPGDDDWTLVFRMKAEAAGRAVFGEFRVDYQVEGESYYQVVPLKIRFEVADRARPLRLNLDEEICAGVVESLVKGGS